LIRRRQQFPEQGALLLAMPLFFFTTYAKRMLSLLFAKEKAIRSKLFA
jgi:hypothetical protein